MRSDDWSRKLHFLDVKTRALEPSFQLLAEAGAQEGRFGKLKVWLYGFCLIASSQLVRMCLQ